VSKLVLQALGRYPKGLLVESIPRIEMGLQVDPGARQGLLDRLLAAANLPLPKVAKLRVSPLG
jgi:hypothetical protein